MIKGLLEGSILSLISKEDIYGYELLERLQEGGFQFVSEGTIYPLLLRLQKEKLIISYSQPSPSGPKRKYYRITEDGAEALNDFRNYWMDIENSVNFFLKKERVKED
ncbi:PadR family transcriptional regulator [Bacillus sp. HMSC76G11]|nr:PadR family transcriptional regulator [Bacillus sp. HMSC76G11]